ncbi:hypothetical protein MM300_19870 [Evansella sp. LMS18]|uniref:hypothetical protein n=1 Tax=Evansella sp. LMS18 TaxID=2924033 RepID=UPI0020D11F63|nr:hypothetical protein [Evansella sp. LMS18]UTR10109.1 hypothetical protein MM300_19870 [Evansella sp. LMS18]
MVNFAELERFQVYIKENPAGFLTVEDAINDQFEQLTATVSEANQSPNQTVTTSIFTRYYGLFLTAQLFLKAHHQIWDGPLDEIYLVQADKVTTFQLDKKYVRDAEAGDLEYILKNYGHTVVKILAEKGNISSYTLWENIWGYAQWMYSTTDTEAGKADLEELLDDKVWQPEMRRSMFRRFLGKKTFSESVSSYERITCCLLKELPDTEKCPYCPHQK